MKTLLIPMSYTPDAGDCAKKAAELFGPDISVVAYPGGTSTFNNAAFPVISFSSRDQLLASVSEAENLILVSPDFGILYKLAAGECEDDLSLCILRALLWGINIHILVDYKIPKYTRDNFFGKLSDTFDTLKSMGIKTDSFGEDKMDQRPPDLVTEDDVIAAGKKGLDHIVCADNAIITPLAKDISKEMNIRIVRVSES